MKKLFLILCLSGCFLSCSMQQTANQYEVVPYPNSLEAKSGKFTLNEQTQLLLQADANEATRLVAAQFAEQLQKTSGITLEESVLEGEKVPANSIGFILKEDIPAEGYELEVEKDRIVVKASQPAGFFYAMQTMKQLLPVEVFGKTLTEGLDWSVPCTMINDAPRFGYRGMHMDVARHFFDIDEVKKYIDILAVHKLNRLHWHLTDDQGWRIEIKKYPKLTEIGSIRKKTMIKKEWDNYDTTPVGGFFTQDQIKEVVEYANDRFITIIPEIDFPGHMMAAMAAYPELGCTGGPYEVSGQWGIRDDVLCMGKEKTFEFFEGVLTEIMELFPSEYIHIGGDECPKIRWEVCPRCQAKIKQLGLKTDDKHKKEHYLQSYAIARVEKFLNDHGRRIIGWDEILEGGLAPNATVMSWRGMDGGIEAARLGHDVIMTPNSHCYFDYYQSLDTESEPFSIGGYVPMQRVYSLEPVPEVLKGDERNHIIGVQANLWTEYISTNEQLEYQLLPRLAALSEVQWMQPELKNWDRFLASLNHITRIYDIMGYNYAKHIYEIIGTYQVNPEKGCVEATLMTQGDIPIYYTLDGTEPTEKSAVYTAPIEIKESCTLKAAVKRDNIETRTLAKTFAFNKATGKKMILNTAPKDKYAYAGATVLGDGIRGDFNYATGCWLGYLDEPMDVTIEFPQPEKISSVTVGALIQMGEWIFPPTKMQVYASADGQDFVEVCAKDIPMAAEKDKDGLKEYGCTFPEQTASKLRVVLNTTDKIPAWHGARGEKAYMFVDEIVVE